MIEFKRILCPIDFSETSLRALSHAAALATWYEAQLEVLHVVPASDDDFLPGTTGDPVRLSRQQAKSLDEIRSAIQRAIEDAGATRANPEVLAREGRPHDVIIQRAGVHPADLLVMGTHGRTGFNRLLMGSITEKVVRTAPCPVLTVPPGVSAVGASQVAFNRILCPIDYSPSALKALQYALALGRQSGGRLTVLYALEYLDPQEPPEHVDASIRKARQHLIEHARERLHTQLAQEPANWCEIDEIVVLDRAYKAILRQAGDTDAVLIVMGAQGTGGLELMLYGSNTQHVVRAAHCPVLTVRA